MKALRNICIALTFIYTVGACASPTPTETITVEVTQEATAAPIATPEPVATTPEPVTPVFTPTPEVTLDAALYDYVLQSTWDEMGYESQEDICWGWINMGAEWSLDQMSELTIPRDIITDFFDLKCLF